MELRTGFELCVFGVRDLRSTETSEQYRAGSQGNFTGIAGLWGVGGRKRIILQLKETWDMFFFLCIIGERLPDVGPVKWQGV